MLRKGHILVISVIAVSFVTVLSIDAQQDYNIPQWVKNNALWWGQGDISDADFISGINFLIDQKVLQVSTTEDDGWKAEADKLYRENQRLQEVADQHYDWYVEAFDLNQEYLQYINELEKKNAELYDAYSYYYSLSTGSSAGNSQYQQPPSTKSTSQPPPTTSSSKNCSGSARCISGSVTKIIDGDTIKVEEESIRFALTSTPELNEYGGQEAKEYLENICPVGSLALVDEDDKQTGGSYGRIIGVIYCNDMNLNEAILDAGLGYLSSGFCSKSEFSTHSWAQRHGC